MVQELDVVKMVWCPSYNDNVDSEDCTFCEYFHGMGDLNFTLMCGFEDNEKNEDNV